MRLPQFTPQFFYCALLLGTQGYSNMKMNSTHYENDVKVIKNYSNVNSIDATPASGAFNVFDTKINFPSIHQSTALPLVRIGFEFQTETNQTYHRQIALALRDNFSSFNYDVGYDSKMFDFKANDSYWIIPGQASTRFVIQSVPDTITDEKLPIGITIDKDREITLKLDALENYQGEAYIYDAIAETYTDVKQGDFIVSLTQGIYHDRFFLVFQKPEDPDNGGGDLGMNTSLSLVRVGFEFPTETNETYHRQIALVLRDSLATFGYDVGYDAVMFDAKANDSYWVIPEEGSTRYVIQSVPNTIADDKLPIGVTIDQDRQITLKLDAAENYNGVIYVYDADLDVYTDITQGDYVVDLTSGVYLSRFFLVFQKTTQPEDGGIIDATPPSSDDDSGDGDDDSNNGTVKKGKKALKIQVFNNRNVIRVRAKPRVKIRNAVLLNSYGVKVKRFRKVRKNRYILNTSNLPLGFYFVKVVVKKGMVTKKIYVK